MNEAESCELERYDGFGIAVSLVVVGGLLGFLAPPYVSASSWERVLWLSAGSLLGFVGFVGGLAEFGQLRLGGIPRQIWEDFAVVALILGFTGGIHVLQDALLTGLAAQALRYVVVLALILGPVAFFRGAARLLAVRSRTSASFNLRDVLALMTALAGLAGAVLNALRVGFVS